MRLLLSFSSKDVFVCVLVYVFGFGFVCVFSFVCVFVFVCVFEKNYNDRRGNLVLSIDRPPYLAPPLIRV